MNDGGAPRPVYLHPGQVFASAESAVVTTVLGSCVSICLWDPASRVGGINHYLLPHLAPAAAASPRFSNVAVRDLVDSLIRLGARRETLQAKMFGGACVSSSPLTPARPHLGERNVTRGLELLREERICVVASDTGGVRGRKLTFLTDDGTVWLKAL